MASLSAGRFAAPLRNSAMFVTEHMDRQHRRLPSDDGRSRPLDIDRVWLTPAPIYYPPLEPPSEKPAPPAAAPAPPNGGLNAWMQVASSFCLYFSTWGIINSYGAYQTYYTESLLASSSPSAIAWIGSTQAFLLFLVGALVGPLYDSGHCRSLLVVGAFCSIFGMALTSVATAYWQIFLAQGVLTGAGFGCLFLPAVTIVSQYFSTRKAIANGVASLGSSFGGVIYPVVFTQVQPRLGASWATGIITFILIATLVPPIVFMRPLKYPPKARSLVDTSAVRDTPYVLFCTGCFLGFMGMYVVFVYIQQYAVAQASVAPSLAFYMLALINAGSTAGRILPNFAADRLGPLNLQVVFVTGSAVLSCALLAIHSTAGVVVFCVLYGFTTGNFLSLLGPSVASLSPSLALLGGRMSMSFFAAGFGLLVGSPIAGAILASQGGADWSALQLWSGLLLFASAAFMASARLTKVGFAFLRKA